MHRQAGLAGAGREVAPAPDKHGQEGTSLPSSPTASGAISVALSPWASTFWVFSLAPGEI